MKATGAVNVFEQLNALRLWEFRIDFLRTGRDIGDNVLQILGSTDFCYYHLAQIRFFNTFYISCPLSFSHAMFSEATAKESEAYASRGLLDCGARVFRIVADAGDSTWSQDHFVVATHASITIEKVLYQQ